MKMGSSHSKRSRDIFCVLPGKKCSTREVNYRSAVIDRVIRLGAELRSIAAGPVWRWVQIVQLTVSTTLRYATIIFFNKRPPH